MRALNACTPIRSGQDFPVLKAKSFPGNGITFAAITRLRDGLALLARQLALSSLGNGGFRRGRVCRRSDGYGT